jgi:outer membrane protein TolC
MMRTKTWTKTAALAVAVTAVLVCAASTGSHVNAVEEMAAPAAESDKELILPVDLSPREAVTLSMADAIRLTLQNNLDIKINRINPEVNIAAVEKAESVFDWTFVGSFSENKSRPAVVSGPGPRSETTSAQVGLTKNLVTGGSIAPTLEWTRSYTNSIFTTLNPSYTTDAFITIRQHLAQGMGIDVNMSGIWIARNNARSSQYGFKTNVINTLANMQRAYWDLIFAIEDLDVKKKALQLTKDTLEQTRAQVEAGILAPIEITRVRADVAANELDIISAQKTVGDREDALRRFINRLSSDLVADIGVIPLERATYKAIQVNVPDAVQQALLNRPDYISAKIAVQSNDINLLVAKNGLLPVVDLSATLSMNGLGAHNDQAFDVMWTNNFNDWTVGVSVAVPLGNRAANAGYLAARLNKVQSLLQLKNFEYQVIIDVKTAARQVVTNLQSIRSTRIARELAEERLRAEEEKFNVGTALILDVLDAQTKLAQAESAERSSIVEYNKSVITLQQAKGTILSDNHIYLSDEVGPPDLLRADVTTTK